MIEKEFTIREPKPSLFSRVFVSIIFTLFFAYVYYLIKEKLLIQKISVIAIVVFIILLLFFVLAITIPKIAIHVIYINFNQLKIKHEFEIGPYIYKEVWQNLKELEYLSVFTVGKKHQANLWYETNKIVNLFVLPNKKEAFKNAYYLADKLNIDLLDATIKGNHQWIDKKHYKQTGEIKYLD